MDNLSILTPTPPPALAYFAEPAVDMVETVALTVGELTLAELLTYDHIVFAFSGGKDSWFCLLRLLDQGVPKEKMELWHHDVDGREGGKLKMDWPSTPDYCRKAAAAFGIPIYFSWKQGGFEGEMLRENALTRPTSFEVPGGGVKTVGGTRGKCSTRRKFPQVGKDLGKRWCSPYLKIDVCATALRNQKRFNGKRVLLITGERAEESPGRAGYEMFEPHKADLRNGKTTKRHIDHYRPAHKATEAEVWTMLEKHRINPMPCYRLGFNRASCMPCIFGNGDQWLSVKRLSPETFETIANYEAEFGCVIGRDKLADGTKVGIRLKVLQPIKKKDHPRCGELPKAYEMDPADMTAAMTTEWTEPIILAPGEWTLPSGAFKEDGCGPS